MSANDELQAHTCEKILEFYGDVANNVAQSNSQDLTEQWKKGELPNGMYYIEFKDGDIAKDVYVFGSWGNINEHFLKQVLAPVPSYEEWQTVFNYATKYEVEYVKCVNDYEELKNKNQQLKELLKECRTMIGKLGAEIGTFDVIEIMLKIDNAMGEKK